MLQSFCLYCTMINIDENVELHKLFTVNESEIKKSLLKYVYLSEIVVNKNCNYTILLQDKI